MKLLRLVLMFALLAGNGISAQTESAGPRHVRFLAVGDLPPFRQEIRDGVRYEIEPPAGSIPPREVLLGFGGGEGEAVSLRLGQISKPLRAPPGAGPLLLRQRGASQDAGPWLRLTRPETGDFLVILWRDSRKKTWGSVGSLVLPDDPASAPAGSVRFVNVSPSAVGVATGRENLVLEAGKILNRKVPGGAEQPFEILLPGADGSLKRLHRGVVVQNSGERSLVLVYRADGIAPRRPLKVAVRREPAPAVVPPK